MDMDLYNIKTNLKKLNIDYFNFQKIYGELLYQRFDFIKPISKIDLLELITIYKFLEKKLPIFVSFRAAQESRNIFNYFINHNLEDVFIFFSRISATNWIYESKLLRSIKGEIKKRSTENSLPYFGPTISCTVALDMTNVYLNVVNKIVPDTK